MTLMEPSSAGSQNTSSRDISEERSDIEKAGVKMCSAQGSEFPVTTEKNTTFQPFLEAHTQETNRASVVNYTTIDWPDLEQIGSWTSFLTTGMDQNDQNNMDINRAGDDFDLHLDPPQSSSSNRNQDRRNLDPQHTAEFTPNNVVTTQPQTNDPNAGWTRTFQPFPSSSHTAPQPYVTIARRSTGLPRPWAPTSQPSASTRSVIQPEQPTAASRPSSQQAGQRPINQNRAVDRVSQTIQWPEPSNEWPHLPASYLNNNIPPRSIGRGMNSGRNLMARFGDDETSRTRYPLIIENARGRRVFPEVDNIYPDPSVIIPMGTSLSDLCAHYPLHVWGTGLRLLMAERWTAERVYDALPDRTKRKGAKQRKWNYLQKAYERQARNMNTEEGLQPLTKPITRRLPLGAKRKSEDSKANRGVDEGEERQSDEDAGRPVKTRKPNAGQPLGSIRDLPQPHPASPANHSQLAMTRPSPANKSAIDPRLIRQPSPGFPSQPRLQPLPQPPPSSQIHFQPLPSHVRQLEMLIQAERNATIRIRSSIFQITLPNFSALTPAQQIHYTTNRVVQYFARWEQSLIDRLIPGDFRHMVTMTETGLQRQFQILHAYFFLHPHPMVDINPNAQQQEYFERIQALNQLLRYMRNFRQQAQAGLAQLHQAGQLPPGPGPTSSSSFQGSS